MKPIVGTLYINGRPVSSCSSSSFACTQNMSMLLGATTPTVEESPDAEGFVTVYETRSEDKPHLELRQESVPRWATALEAFLHALSKQDFKVVLDKVLDVAVQRGKNSIENK